MPELPDVETFKRYFDATSLHQQIVDVDVLSADLLKGVSGRELARKLKGRRFESSRRQGKHLFAQAAGDTSLRLHFGMTGFLRYFKGEEKAPPPHTRVLFVFAKDRRLVFDDQRKFGEVGLVEDVDDFLKKRGLAPNVLDVDLAKFKELFAKHRGAVKSVLMNQKLIVGIGNIYADDEIVFHARIRPATRTARLGDKPRKLSGLFRVMRHMLQKAIDSQANVDRTPTAWFCPHCQRRAL